MKLDVMFKGFILAIVLSISIVFYGGYLFYKSLQPQIIESRNIVLPKIKLETDGKRTDTIYVYRFEWY